MTDVSKIVAFRRPPKLRLVADAGRDLSLYPRFARAFGLPLVPPRPPVAPQDNDRRGH